MGTISAAEGRIRVGARYYLKAIQADAKNIRYYLSLLLTPFQQYLLALKHRLKTWKS